MWEAAGLLLGPEEVATEAQAQALASLLQPLSAQIQVRPRRGWGFRVLGS